MKNNVHVAKTKIKTGVLKAQFRDICDIAVGFASYIKTHSLSAIIVAIVTALCYAKQAYSINHYIDAEFFINNPETYYNWLDIGRFGLVLLKELLGLAWYNPYFEASLFLLALWGVGIFSGYLFKLLDDGIGDAEACVFSLLVIISPNYAEQFMFRFQALEIVLGIWLLLFADACLVKWIQNGNTFAYIFSLLPLILSFGTYQNMPNIQIAVCLGIFLMRLFYDESFRSVRRIILGFMVHFLLAFFIYEAVVQLFFTEGEYLGSQIMWGEKGIWQCVFDIRAYLVNVYDGNGIFGTSVYSVALWLSIFSVMAILYKKHIRGLWYAAGVFGLALSPFLLGIVMGAGISGRSQMTLPFSCAVMWLFSCRCISNVLCKAKRILAGIIILIGIGLIYLQAASLTRLFYTEDIVRRADMMTASAIIDDIEKIPSAHKEKPIVFLGYRGALCNASCFSDSGESYLTKSVFEYDYAAEPEYFYSTHRILQFFQTLGYSYALPSPEIYYKAREYYDEMTCWPLEGSIREFDEFIIIRL